MSQLLIKPLIYTLYNTSVNNTYNTHVFPIPHQFPSPVSNRIYHLPGNDNNAFNRYFSDVGRYITKFCQIQAN